MELVVITVGMASLVLSVWAMLDALRAHDRQWHAIGRNRLAWVAVIGISVLAGPIGGVVAAVYLIAVRPALAAARTVES